MLFVELLLYNAQLIDIPQDFGEEKLYITYYEMMMTETKNIMHHLLHIPFNRSNLNNSDEVSMKVLSY